MLLVAEGFCKSLVFTDCGFESHSVKLSTMVAKSVELLMVDKSWCGSLNGCTTTDNSLSVLAAWDSLVTATRASLRATAGLKIVTVLIKNLWSVPNTKK